MGNFLISKVLLLTVKICLRDQAVIFNRYFELKTSSFHLSKTCLRYQTFSENKCVLCIYCNYCTNLFLKIAGLLITFLNSITLI